VLTAADGTTTKFARNDEEAGAAEVEAARVAVARRYHEARCTDRETGAQRRARRAEASARAREDFVLAERAAKECPELVMTPHEMEQLWRSAAAKTVRITPILPRGLQQRAQEEPESIRVCNIAARGAAASSAPQAAVARFIDVPSVVQRGFAKRSTMFHVMYRYSIRQKFGPPV